MTATLPTDPAILAEQVAYYRKRAGEYDEWWFRTGRYDHGAELNAAWVADVARGRDRRSCAISIARGRRARSNSRAAPACSLVGSRRGSDALRAVDASPEVQAINRARVAADNVDYATADLFAWQPSERYDFVFMSFWLSHVPAIASTRFGPRCAPRWRTAAAPT